MDQAISRIATRIGVDKDILARVVWNESRGNKAIGMDKTNYSAGIGQISRGVWSRYSKLPYSLAADPSYYEQNLEVSARYLKDNYRKYGSWRLAMEAYNEGPGTLNQILAGKRGLSPITQKYVAGINK